jgi:hypothetical protein
MFFSVLPTPAASGGSLRPVPEDPGGTGFGPFAPVGLALTLQLALGLFALGTVRGPFAVGVETLQQPLAVFLAASRPVSVAQPPGPLARDQLNTTVLRPGTVRQGFGKVLLSTPPFARRPAFVE